MEGAFVWVARTLALAANALVFDYAGMESSDWPLGGSRERVIGGQPRTSSPWSPCDAHLLTRVLAHPPPPCSLSLHHLAVLGVVLSLPSQGQRLQHLLLQTYTSFAQYRPSFIGAVARRSFPPITRSPQPHRTTLELRLRRRRIGVQVVLITHKEEV